MSKSLTIREISSIDIGLSIIMNQKLPIIPSWRFGQWKQSTENIVKDANKKREELIKELGAAKPDGSFEVLPKNKEVYFDSFNKLQDEKKSIEIPQIQVSLLKDIPTTVKFTTLVGHYLELDAVKIKYDKYPDITNQQILDMDLGISLIMNEQMPIGLALKLGDAKRKAEAVSVEYREKRSELIKKYGELNDTFDHEITDPAKKELFDIEIDKWLNTKREKPLEVPTLLISEFEAQVTIDGKKQDLKFPLRFFTLLSNFIKEKEEKQEKPAPKKAKKDE